MHCALCTVHWALPCALCFVPSALCIVHCALCVVQSVAILARCLGARVCMCILHCAVCIVHCTLCSVWQFSKNSTTTLLSRSSCMPCAAGAKTYACDTYAMVDRECVSGVDQEFVAGVTLARRPAGWGSEQPAASGQEPGASSYSTSTMDALSDMITCSVSSVVGAP